MQEIEIIIKKEKFLPVYWPLLDNTEEFDIDFLWGGRDSGKSRHIAMQLLVECINADYFKCLLIRKILNTVRDSQYSLIKSVAEEWKIDHLFHFNGTRLEIICKHNKNGFYGRGLDDVGRIKSFNNPSHSWLEEMNQMEANDMVVILTSLRTNRRKVKTFCSFNPECEVNYTDFWLWDEYFSHTEEKNFKWTRTISTPKGDVEFKIRSTHATYKDNPYCDDQRIALYESYKNSKNNAYWYSVYTLGEWGYRKPEGRFFKSFDDSKHTLDLLNIPQINEGNWTLHIAADNNVAPYVAIQIWIVDLKGRALLQIGEIPCITPDNTATKAAKKVVDYLIRRNYNDKVFIYGDPSANAKSTTDDNGRSFFDKFIGVIKDAGYEYVNRVGKSAPSVSQSSSFINEIFEHNFDGWKIFIDKNCVKSTEDYNMVVEAMDGTMVKKRITVKATGASYEKWGHFADCFVGETLITTDKGQKRIDEINVGDRVLTRKGFKKVTYFFDRGIKKVETFNIGDKRITCTPNHRFYTEENGFIEVNKLRMQYGIFCIFDEQTNTICKKKLFTTTEEDLRDIQILKTEANGFIIQDGLSSMAKKPKKDYIITNILLRLVKLKKAIIYTISMKTPSITTLQTLKRNGGQTILVNTQVNDLKATLNLRKDFTRQVLRPQKNGTTLQRVDNGIHNMQLLAHQNGNLKQRFVNFVMPNIKQGEFQYQIFAQTNVNRQVEENRELIILKEIVKDAESHLPSIDTQSKNIVQDIVNRQVFDIEVEDEHEFFANGILVHNCFRYTATTILKEEYTKFLQRRNGAPRPGGVAKAQRVKPKLG